MKDGMGIGCRILFEELVIELAAQKMIFRNLRSLHQSFIANSLYLLNISII